VLGSLDLSTSDVFSGGGSKRQGRWAIGNYLMDVRVTPHTVRVNFFFPIFFFSPFTSIALPFCCFPLSLERDLPKRIGIIDRTPRASLTASDGAKWWGLPPNEVFSLGWWGYSFGSTGLTSYRRVSVWFSVILSLCRISITFFFATT
jgi:hypothetical protein